MLRVYRYDTYPQEHWHWDGKLGFPGMDIGPYSKRKLIDTNGQRAVIRVGGHQTPIGAPGMGHMYFGPKYYLILDRKLVADIRYDRAGATMAQFRVYQFLRYGDVPTPEDDE